MTDKTEATTEETTYEQSVLILGAAAEVMAIAEQNVHEQIQYFKVKYPYTYPFRANYWDLCNKWYKCFAASQKFDATLKGIAHD